MPLLGKYYSKLLVLLYLGACIVAIVKAGTNETEKSTTTTAKPEAQPPEAESALVETSVNLEGQETRAKSASHGYLADDKSYLSQESIYHKYPHEEQVYEYGKRIAGPYKGSVDDGYHQDHTHYPQSGYIASQGHYEQQQIDDYDHDTGKGIAYPDVKSHDDSYGNRHLDGYSHSSGKGAPYQQVKIQTDSYGKDDYGHSNGKGIDYSQAKIQDDSYGKELDDYGHSVGKGTPYLHGKIQEDSYGKEHVDDYSHSNGKGTPYQHGKIQDDHYGKEHIHDYDHSSGKGTSYEQTQIGGDSYGKEHLDDYGHSNGKGTPYQPENIHDDSYGEKNFGNHEESYSSFKTIGNSKAPYSKYSYEVPKKQFVSGDQYDVKSYGESAGYGSEDVGYHGKGNDEGSYGKGGSSGYSHGSKSSDYSSGGHNYASAGKISHFPVVPKESEYIAGGNKESGYLHQSPKGSTYQHEIGYHSDSGASVGIPHSDVSQKKVAVFIKQIGHSKGAQESYGPKHGERHGFLLLPVVPGKPEDKIKIETTGGYGGLDYKNIAQDYVQKPISENNGKYSFSSYFKSGSANYGIDSGKSYNGNSKSNYGGHSKSSTIPHGGHFKSEISSYGGDSKLHHDDKEHYDQGIYGGHSGEVGYGVSQTAKGHNSYEPHYKNVKHNSYDHDSISQYNKEPLIYEGEKSTSDHVSGYGINGNVKYINSQEFDNQKSYGKGGITSYEVANTHKGTPFGTEGSSIDAHNSYSSGHLTSKGSYDAAPVVKSSPASYGKQISIASVKGKGGYGQSHGYESQKSYGAEIVSPYAFSSGGKHGEIKGKGFPPVSYGFTPMIGPYGSVVDFSRSASKKSVSSKIHDSGYKSGGIQEDNGHSKHSSSSYRGPKSFAVILQRTQSGHSGGSKSPSYPVNIKGGRKSSSHGYGEQGFQPILSKHGPIGDLSQYYNLHSYGSSPRYSAVAHPKGFSRKY